MQPQFPIDINSAVFHPLSVVPNSERSPKLIQIIDPEFSSVCPKTGLPDYGRVVLRYTPLESCVELKDWKLFLRSFYGVGCFHEDVTQRIANAFVDAVKPAQMRLVIDWGARGGLHTTTSLSYECEAGFYQDDFRHEVFVKHAAEWDNK